MLECTTSRRNYEIGNFRHTTKDVRWKLSANHWFWLWFAHFVFSQQKAFVALYYNQRTVSVPAKVRKWQVGWRNCTRRPPSAAKYRRLCVSARCWMFIVGFAVILNWTISGRYAELRRSIWMVWRRCKLVKFHIYILLNLRKPHGR